MTDLPKTIAISDPAFIARVARVSERRGDSTVTKTARDLIHERMIDLERNGDPAAATVPEGPQPKPGEAA